MGRKRTSLSSHACRVANSISSEFPAKNRLFTHYPVNCASREAGEKRRAAARKSTPRLLCGSDDEVAKGDVSGFTSLQIDGSGQSFMAVQCAAGDPWYLLFINNRLTVLHNRHHAANEGDVVGLPLSRTAPLFRRWGQEPIHSTRAHRWPFRLRIIFDLNFVASAQVDAAVRSLRAVEFNV